AWALLNFVYFCPREYVNFLWNTILIPLTPGVGLLAAMEVNFSKFVLCWKFLTIWAFPFVLPYSFSGACFLWVLPLPFFFWPRLAGAQNRRANPASWYAVYAFCGVVAVGFYFHHYVRPTRLPPFAVSLADALPLLRFFLSWIGSLFVVPGADPLLFGCFYLAI